MNVQIKVFNILLFLIFDYRIFFFWFLKIKLMILGITSIGFCCKSLQRRYFFNFILLSFNIFFYQWLLNWFSDFLVIGITLRSASWLSLFLWILNSFPTSLTSIFMLLTQSFLVFLLFSTFSIEQSVNSFLNFLLLLFNWGNFIIFKIYLFNLRFYPFWDNLFRPCSYHVRWSLGLCFLPLLDFIFKLCDICILLL